MVFPNRLSALAVTTVVVTAMVSGCDHGGSEKTPAGETTPAVNLDSLNTGNYPVKPAAALGAAGTEAIGRRLEGARIATAVVPPWQVDSALTDVWKKTVILRPESLSSELDKRLPKEVWDIAGHAGMVSGFVTDRRSPDPAAAKRWLQNAVWEFPSPQAAADTVAEMTAKMAAVSTPDHPRTPTTVPGHPETSASYVDLASYINKITEKAGSGIAVNALTAHGPFVLYQEAVAASNPADATALIADTLTKQTAALDKFVPTDKSALAALPRDTTGLLARTLPFAKGDGSYEGNLVWDPVTYVNFDTTPVSTAKLLTDSNVKWVASAAAVVFQTSSGDDAKRLRDAKVKELVETTAKTGTGEPNTYKPAAEVPGLSDSKCLEANFDYATYNKFRCYGVLDSYTFTSSSAQLIDAQQQLAAQYRILASK